MIKNFDDYSTSRNISYENSVTAFSDNFKRVIVDRETIDKINEFVPQIVAAKEGESHHKVDGANEVARFTSGLMGEAALEKLLGINIIEWEVGDSKVFNHPDIPGYNVGIKTVKKGHFPVIFKDNRYPQIICIRSDYREDLVFVCGLATPEVLNKYQSDELVGPSIRARGTKTGFYGFSELIPVRSLNDIARYKK